MKPLCAVYAHCAPDAEDALRALLSVLAELPPNVVLILHGLLNGKSLVESGH